MIKRYYYIICLATFLILSLPMKALSQKSNDLLDYRWKNRLLLLFTESENSTVYRKQIQLLNSQKLGLQDRDLIVFSFFADNSGKVSESILQMQEVVQIRKKYKVTPNEQIMILIGKDGGEKLRRPMPVQVNSIYGLIDQMPMRRQEMKQSDY